MGCQRIKARKAITVQMKHDIETAGVTYESETVSTQNWSHPTECNLKRKKGKYLKEEKSSKPMQSAVFKSDRLILDVKILYFMAA